MNLHLYSWAGPSSVREAWISTDPPFVPSLHNRGSVHLENDNMAMNFFLERALVVYYVLSIML